MAGDTETVSLNLEGNFAAQADKDARAAEKLSTSLAKANDAMVRNAKAGIAANATAAAGLRAASPWQAMVQGEGFAKIRGVVAKLFGEGAGNKLQDGAKGLAEAGDKLGVTPEKLQSAAGAVAAGGAVVITAAAALAAAATTLLAAGAKFGIETTDAAKTQAAIFKEIGKGGAYGNAVKIATELGLPEDTAIAKTKALLNAKLEQSTVKDIIKVGIGLDAVQGEGAGEGFAKTLEKIKNVGKFDAKSIKEFAKEGISAEDVYKKLAQTMGTTVDAVKAKVKAGTLDVDKGIQGVLDVAKGKFGKIADILADSIPALIQKVRNAFAGLFKNFDLGPVKAILKEVAKVLEGPSGQALGRGLSALFSALSALFGGIGGQLGGVEGVVDTVTGALVKVAGFIKGIAPDVAAFVKGFKKGFGEFGPVLSQVGAIIKSILTAFGPSRNIIMQFGMALGAIAGTIVTVIGVFGIFASVIVRVVTTLAAASAFALGAFLYVVALVGNAVARFVGGITSIPGRIKGAFVSVGAQARSAGNAMATGLTGGIASGIAGAVAMAGRLASAALAKIKAVLGVASPAKALVFVGDMMAGGMAKGMNDNADKPAKAAGKMAAGAAGAAAGGASGGKGGAGAGGGAGGPVTIIVQIGGNVANAQAVGQAAGAAAAEEWKRQMRSWQREQQEGRAA